MTTSRALRVVAGVSLVYDLSIGVVLLVATGTMAGWFGVPLPTPAVFVKLDALFLICVGLGYLQPLRNPDAHRAYLWVFGPVLKGAGAAAFLVDHIVNGTPASFLIFAGTDGALALATLAVLLRQP